MLYGEDQLRKSNSGRVAKRFLRRIRNRCIHSGLILTYHRITDAEPDPWGLCVKPKRFEEHLQVIQRYSLPLTVDQLVQKFKDRRMPRLAVAVSFDDGYADNLLEAKPLLERQGVPATFFVAPGLLDGRSEFWWDELEQVFIRPGTMPDELVLQIGGRTFRRVLGGAKTLTERDHRAHRHWLACQPPTARHRFFVELWGSLKPLSHEARQPLLAEIAAWAGVEVVPRTSHRPLSMEELSLLGTSSLVEIGAHTMTHPSLPSQTAVIQRDEIGGSKRACEEAWSREVVSFAYPYGEATPATANIVREMGMVSASVTRAGRLFGSVNLYRLPRLYVGDWDGEAFEQLFDSV